MRIKVHGLIMLLLIMGVMVGCNDTRRYRILIPETYHGTVYVYFGVKGAPALKIEDAYQLIIVPNDGIVRTSSEIIPGKCHDEYYFYSDKRRTPLPPHRLGGGGTSKQSNAPGEKDWYYFFEVL